jgi:ferredoxin-NADP reductase
MASKADRREWRRATVVWSRPAAADMVSLALRPDQWISHVAGQYYDIRFPREGVVRAFSIVSSPTVTDYLEFGLQVLPRGLLSPRLAAVAPGEPLEIRGPVGRFFTWSPEMSGRLVLIGAGAGITPLLSMYGHAVGDGFEEGPVSGVSPPLFIVSAGGPERVFRYERYRSVLVTRFSGREGRIDREFLAEHLAGIRDGTISREPPPQIRICGPPGFVGHIVDHLLSQGISETSIRSEAFV